MFNIFYCFCHQHSTRLVPNTSIRFTLAPLMVNAEYKFVSRYCRKRQTTLTVNAHRYLYNIYVLYTFIGDAKSVLLLHERFSVSKLMYRVYKKIHGQLAFFYLYLSYISPLLYHIILIMRLVANYARVPYIRYADIVMLGLQRWRGEVGEGVNRTMICAADVFSDCQEII